MSLLQQAHIDRLFFTTSTNRVITIEFKCDHYNNRQSCNNKKQFLDGKMQQVGTILHKDSQAPSRKGKSRSSFNQLAHINNTQANNTNIDPPANGRKPNQKNRSTSKLPIDEEHSCNVIFSVYCESVTKKWYLSLPHKSKSTCKEDTDTLVTHSNHLPNNPDHLPTTTNDLSEEVQTVVSNHIQIGTAIDTIANMVKQQFDINITHNQIKTMKKQQIENIIADFNGNHLSDVAKMSAAEKLIKLFETMSDVSFVYVKHHINSGFVSYQKDRSSDDITQSNFSDEDNSLVANEIDIDSWRASLGLNNANEILVAFAWCHDYERRKIRMYPEFLAIDGTFGSNRQRRSLLTGCGIDSEKKTFTGFRCFMPSKQRRAYSWAIGKAMPFLVGKSIEYNQVLSCDMEQALMDACVESINRPMSPLSKSKLRIDYYHLFEQKWNEHVSFLLLLLSIMKQYVY